MAAAAVKLIDADHARFESEAAVLRQRLGVVQSEITSLITSLKAVSGAGAELLHGELDRLQAEQGDLRKRLKEVCANGAPLAAAVARAR